MHQVEGVMHEMGRARTRQRTMSRGDEHGVGARTLAPNEGMVISSIEL